MRGTARQIKRRGRRLAERLFNLPGKLRIPPKPGVTGFFAALERPVTMARLDRMLRTEGWTQPPDHLDSFAPANRWIGDSR